ncbi:hypothetical protein [Paraburkholderia sp. EG304]
MTCYRFASRAPMSYRRVLRTVPKALRRAWWRQRYHYDEPRTAIGNGPF